MSLDVAGPFGGPVHRVFLFWHAPENCAYISAPEAPEWWRLVSITSPEVAYNSDCSEGTFAELSDLTELAVARGPADTRVSRPCLSGGGAAQATLAEYATGKTAVTLCVTLAGVETCGVAPRRVTSVKEG